MTRPSDVAAWLQDHQFRASRVLGQNFLVDVNILRILLEAADVRSSDHILEIGPGLGVVTGPLLEIAARVTAVEKDEELYRHLVETLGSIPHIRLVYGDVTSLSLPRLLEEEAITKVVSNLPFVVASRCLVDLAFAARRPQRIVVTLQQEVAKKLTAKPGSKAYSALTILVGHAYHASLQHRVPPTCFLPRPRVYSTIVCLTPVQPPMRFHTGIFRALVRGAFSQRRKQLGTILPRIDLPGVAKDIDRVGILKDLAIEPVQRPETLSVDRWIQLAKAFSGELE